MLSFINTKDYQPFLNLNQKGQYIFKRMKMLYGSKELNLNQSRFISMLKRPNVATQGQENASLIMTYMKADTALIRNEASLAI